MGKNIFAGGLLSYTPQATDALFDGLRQMFGKMNAKKLSAIADKDLQSVGSMFTLSWLFDTPDRATDSFVSWTGRFGVRLQRSLGPPEALTVRPSPASARLPATA
ncbi:hypothetical protein [Mesorhizobium xinjiangense]|uniref:hypothetical protein n=1 Tax=Mesorhizobium xinjiangense TaxID=2678685 RepID=UPI001F2BC112|nr:hypothetical protein [Mesorhizobium xinjiangense]